MCNTSLLDLNKLEKQSIKIRMEKQHMTGKGDSNGEPGN